MMHSSLSTPLLLLFLLLEQCLSAAQYTPNVPIESRTIDQIYTAAQTENCNLTVVVGGDALVSDEPLIDAFTARFPNVALNLTNDVSKYLDGRIDRAFYANDEYIDVAMLETLQDYTRWKAENRLLYYKAAVWNDIVNGKKDLDGAYVPYELADSFGTFYYNSTRLNSSDLPSTYGDLLDPRWKSKLVLAYPNDDDAVAYLFSIIILRYGFSWFQTLVRDQDVLWIRSTAKSALALTSGPFSMPGRLLTSTTGEASTLQKAMPDDQLVSWWQRAAIMRSTKCPESARLFISFLLSDAWQSPISQAGAGVPLNSLNVASGIDIFASNSTQTQGFHDYMMDRAMAERWRFQFEDLLGPPQGPDPAGLQ